MVALYDIYKMLTINIFHVDNFIQHLLLQKNNENLLQFQKLKQKFESIKTLGHTTIVKYNTENV